MNDNGKVVVGVLAGIAIGATLGVLFAPHKGAKTRGKIAKKGHDVAENLEEKFNEFKESITRKFDKLTSEAAEIQQKMKQSAEKAQSDSDLNTKL